MSFNPNQFYLPPNGMPNPGMMPQQAYPGAPGQPQPFNLAALQQQQQQAPPVQVPQRNGTPQQLPQGFPGVPAGMPQPFMGGGAPPGMMQQQQQHPSAGQVNVAAFEQLLRSGQLTPEQFATLQSQIRTHQQQQAQKQAQAQAQAVANASQQQHQQPQQPMAFLGGAPPPQQQPPMPMPTQPPAHAPQPPPNGGDHIPIQLLQQYSAQLAQIRALQQKLNLLGTVLQTGLVGGQQGTDGQVQGQTRLSPQQRPLVEKQLDETKRQVGGMVQTVQNFQKQWTPQRIQADFQFYQSQRTGQQSTPVQPQQPLPPPPQQQPQQQQRPPLQAMPSGSAPNLYSSPQQQQAALTAQMLQRQAQAQAQMQAQAQAQAHAQAQAQAQAIAAAAAGRSTPVQPAPQQLAPPPQQNFQPQPVLQQQQQQFMPTPQMMPPPAMPPLHLLQNQLNPQLFMKSLFEVMRKRGEPIDTTPYCDGREVDLYQLYQAVMVHGGSQQVNQHGTWHRIAAHLGYPADTSHQALRDAPPDTQRISLELARLYQKMLRPFEEIWGKSLVTQQQRILEAQRAGQAVPGMQPQPAPPPPQQQQQPPPPQQQQQQQQQQAPQQPQRPPSQNAASRPGLQQAPSASQLEASRQQLLQQAKAASLAAQQVGAGGAALAAKQQQQQQAQAQQSQQQQLQNGGAAAAAGAGKVNTEPTLEQVAEAKNSVTQIRLSIDQTRPKLKLLEVADDQKQAVARLTHELIPHVRKVMDTLPLFLAMTGDESAVRKMLTFAAIFQDQMRYMSTNQFALDLSGLTQLREQFQRCWNFMKQNPLGRGTGAVPGQQQQQQRPPAQGAATSPPIKPEQFNAAAQGRGLRVEDLKPPPMKHRRTASGVAGTSPAAAPSPSTPQTAAGSPPQAGATPGATKPTKARRGAVKKEPVGAFPGSSPAAGASPAATLAALRSDLIKDSPSPMGIVVPPAPVLVPEEPPSIKRKREEDEMDRDPNAFIERTLRIIDQPVFAPADFGIVVGSGGGSGGAAPASGPTHAAGLSLDFDPAIPPILNDASAPPLSFTAYSSSSSYADALAPSFATVDSTAAAAAAAAVAPADQPFNFDLYIDSSAAGFDTPDQVDAPTPDLVGSSSGSAPTPATPGDALAATPQTSNASLKSPSKQAPSPLGTVGEDAPLSDAFYGGGGLVVDDVDAWLNGGPSSKLSSALSWEAQQGNDTPALASSWNFYPEF